MALSPQRGYIVPHLKIILGLTRLTLLTMLEILHFRNV